MVSCACSKEGFASSARHQVTIQAPASAEDDTGGRDEGWTAGDTVWAIIEPMAGREIFVSAQLQSRCDARITIRYRPSLADTKEAAQRRVVFGTRVYNVVALRNLAGDMKGEGTDFQQLFCVEGEPS